MMFAEIFNKTETAAATSADLVASLHSRSIAASNAGVGVADGSGGGRPPWEDNEEGVEGAAVADAAGADADAAGAGLRITLTHSPAWIFADATVSVSFRTEPLKIHLCSFAESFD